MNANPSSGCSFVQSFADQTPKYDGQVRKKKRRSGGLVKGKNGILRDDKRSNAIKFVT
jgi:hypothetical protein